MQKDSPAIVLLAGLCMSLMCLFSSNYANCAETDKDTRRWLAGDHHIHSQYSVGWDLTQNPPAAKLGGEGIYSIPMNAAMARRFGLSWTVATDHGGPNHSKIHLEMAYPELLRSRSRVPEVVQFYGMELNTPAGDHSSLILPHTHDEAKVLYKLESEFDKREVYPPDPSRDTEEKMIEALQAMKKLEAKPLVIANHPSRSAIGYGMYGQYDPAELRRWNDTAPDIAVGMAGAPGHQAVALSNLVLITDDSLRVRGGYRLSPTKGGFDQMTARLGGFWDSMLAEGRRWWITANSDSHKHYTEQGLDFWPGEYSKTYVFAEKNHDSILAGLRAGRIFVTTGDLITELFVEVTAGEQSAGIGEGITVDQDGEVIVTIRFVDPEEANGSGEDPKVKRVDLIFGEVSGRAADRSKNSNRKTMVAKRFSSSDWTRQGRFLTISHTLNVDTDAYIRVRGTNTDELEPEKDPPAENPWGDLWFYSNPVFIEIR